MNRALFELQLADDVLHQLVRERSKLDDGTAARAARAALQQQVDAAQARLRELNATRSDKELEQKSIEEKIAKQQGRLMNAKSAHEVTSLQRDIEGLNHARGDLDESILTLMDEGDTAKKELADLEQQLATQSATTTAIERTHAAETARIDGEIEVAKVQRQKSAHGISDADLDKYVEFFKRFHGLAVAHNEKGSCSGCGMALTPYNLREAKGQEWPTCENCGRLLFLE